MTTETRYVGTGMRSLNRVDTRVYIKYDAALGTYLWTDQKEEAHLFEDETSLTNIRPHSNYDCIPDMLTVKTIKIKYTPIVAAKSEFPKGF